MFRVTWRQHRLTLIGLAALLGGCAASLLAERPAMRSSWSSLGLNHCSFPLRSQAGPCRNHLDTFANLPYRSADLAMVSQVAPALIGMFAGAPLLAREFETGTFQYTLAQGITPERWAAGKLAALSTVIAVAALGVRVAFTWWYSLTQWTMTQTAPGGWGSGTFGLFAVAFAGWAVLAFNLGALAGAAIQRTVRQQSPGEREAPARWGRPRGEGNLPRHARPTEKFRLLLWTWPHPKSRITYDILYTTCADPGGAHGRRRGRAWP